MKLSEQIREIAGDGIGEREFVSIYYGDLHRLADEAKELEDKLDRVLAGAFEISKELVREWGRPD